MIHFLPNKKMKTYDEEYQFYALPALNEKKRKLSQTNTNTKKKRKQVKRACVNCRSAHTGCDHERPCKRCTTHGLEDSCCDQKKKVSKTEEKQKDLIIIDETKGQIKKEKKVKKSIKKQLKKEETSEEEYSEDVEESEEEGRSEKIIEEEEEEEEDEEIQNIREKKEIEIYNCDTFLHRFEEKFLLDFEKDLRYEKEEITSPKEKNIEFPDTCVAVWSLDGTLSSSNKDFNTLFKMPKNFINYTKFGPHYKKIVHKNNLNYVLNIFDEIFSNKKQSFIGIVELSPFASDFQFSLQQPILKCQMNLQIIYGKNFSPKYVVSYLTLID
jgi:hypothetical protein